MTDFPTLIITRHLGGFPANSHPGCTSRTHYILLRPAPDAPPLLNVGEFVLDTGCLEMLNQQDQHYALSLILPRGDDPFTYRIDRRPLKARAGQYAIVNPNQLAQREIKPHVSYSNVHVGQKILREVREAMNLHQQYGPFDFDTTPHGLHQLLQGPLDTLQNILREPQQPGASLLLQSASIELLIRLIQHHENPLSQYLTTPPHRMSLLDPRIRRAMDYLRDHLKHEVSLEELAQACGLSVATLYRQFVTQTGTTPWRFLRQQRLDLAVRLLKNEGCTVEEAAIAVGYRSDRGLRKAFVEVYGFAPHPNKQTS